MKWPNINLKNFRTMRDINSSKFKPKKLNLNNATLSDIMTLKCQIYSFQSTLTFGAVFTKK